MKLTAIGSGYFKVFKNGVEASKHTTEREAIEAAVALETANPVDVISYKHDYEVRVEAPIPADPAPAPAPVVRRLFAPDSFYNAKLADNAPIHANSANIVRELVRQAIPQNTDSTRPRFDSMNPVYDTPTYDPRIMYYGNVNSRDFTSALWIIEDPATPKVPVTIVQNGAPADWAGDLYLRLKSGVRVPVDADGNPGTDGHIAIWDKVDDVLVECWQFKKDPSLGWIASFGGIIEGVSNSNGVFPAMKNKWGTMFETGATATSLSLAGGMIKLDEMKRGVIGHAIGFAIPEGPNRFVAPAKRTDGPGNQFWEGPNVIPAGTRFRFPKDIVIDPNWIPLVKMMVEAIRDYGCVVQDRAGAVCFYAENTAPKGDPDSTDEYRKKADGTLVAGWQFMNPNYFPFSKLQVLA